MARTRPIEQGRGRRAHGARPAVAVLAVALALAGGTAPAMPVDTKELGDVPGVTGDGELDIREVLDTSTEMDIRLTKQIMLLQRQINDLKKQIETMQAAQAPGN